MVSCIYNYFDIFSDDLIEHIFDKISDEHEKIINELEILAYCFNEIIHNLQIDTTDIKHPVISYDKTYYNMNYYLFNNLEGHIILISNIYLNYDNSNIYISDTLHNPTFFERSEERLVGERV